MDKIYRIHCKQNLFSWNPYQSVSFRENYWISLRPLLDFRTVHFHRPFTFSFLDRLVSVIWTVHLNPRRKQPILRAESWRSFVQKRTGRQILFWPQSNQRRFYILKFLSRETTLIKRLSLLDCSKYFTEGDTLDLTGYENGDSLLENIANKG